MKNNFFLFSLIILMGFSACKSKKLSETNFKKLPAQTIVNELKKNDLNYKFLSASGTIAPKLEGKKMSANFNLRMEKDHRIWISVRLAMIEGMRALITPDSVKIINRLDKDNNFAALSFDSLKSLSGINLGFQELQATLLGNFEPLQNLDFKTKKDPNAYKIKAKDEKIEYTISTSGNPFKMTEIFAKLLGSKETLKINYINYKTKEEQYYPDKMVLNLSDGKNKAEVIFKYNKMNFPEKLNFPFKKPKKNG